MRQKRAITVSPDDVEQEITRLFGDPEETGLVITIHGEDGTVDGRSEAFQELLSSLALYDFAEKNDISVKPPDLETMTKALSVLGQPHVKRRLFERILLTFGKKMVDPLGKILDTTPEGLLFERMTDLRATVLTWIRDLEVTQETQEILADDIRKLLSDDYLTMLADHEEKIQRPKVTDLAQQILHIIGSTFQRAFRSWPEHARTIAESVTRRMGSKLSLSQSPVVIKQRIIEGIEEYLWIETSTELEAVLAQMFQQPQYLGIIAAGPPQVERETYREFSEACWDIVSENC